MKAIVVRGFITRYCQEIEWEVDLVEARLEDLQADGDAIPFYVEGNDGKYHEYYEYEFPSDGRKVYVEKGMYD